MKPFRLTIKLITPLQVGKHAPRLDGLFWHTLFSHLGSERKAVDALSDYLQLADSAGKEYYKASNMCFASVSAAPGDKTIDSLVGLTTAKTGVMRSGSDLSPDSFRPNSKRGDKYTKVQVLGGPYKNRLDKKLTYHASHVVFDGVGKGEEIADLIRFYIPAIGVNANSGFGTIGDVYCSQLTEDRSLIDHAGQCARPIPVEEFSGLSSIAPMRTGDAILMPPFRNQQPIRCVIPERIRKIIIAKPGAQS